MTLEERFYSHISLWQSPTACCHCSYWSFCSEQSSCPDKLRWGTAMQIPSMTVGGALWFTDLTIADPYYLLPITASAIFLLTVELGAADGMQVCSVRRMPLTNTHAQSCFVKCACYTRPQ